jgi:sugar phosphate isomerase/epimerase
MFKLSAFADEIDADPQQQIDVLKACRIRFIEFRSILGVNVLNLTQLQIDEFDSLRKKHGIGISAIGSPIGKVRIDEPFDGHWQRFERAIELAKRFETPNIRVFSYYPAEGATEADWPRWRDQVVQRMEEKVRRAEAAGLTLFHENEHRIYGDSPDRVADLLTSIPSSSLAAAYDPANFVFCGYDPWEGWMKCRDRVRHFHIKDWVAGEKHGCVAGTGQGQIPRVLTDAVTRGYRGFAVLEPHLLGGGPTGGVTGPDLFPKAVEALRQIIADCGGVEG